MIKTVFLPKLPDIKESTPEMHLWLCGNATVTSLDIIINEDTC
jgi:hypothetical protein